MVQALKEINVYLADFDNIIGVIGVIVAVIGIAVGGLGVKQIKDAKKIKINNSNVNNSQVANTINNSGVGVKDAEYIASKVAGEKLKDRPSIITSENEPEEQEVGGYWVKNSKL